MTITPDSLAAALIKAVKAQQFEATADQNRGGAPISHFPSIDLAVIAFAADGKATAANVLFSREHPNGIQAQFNAQHGAVNNIQYLADQTDKDTNSIAWTPNSDWKRMQWQVLAGQGQRVVAPYPASLVKLMVLVGVARAIDAGAASWDDIWPFDGQRRSLLDWADPMIVVSSNDATTALVAFLHHAGVIVRTPAGEQRNGLNQAFASFGLHTLRLSDTKADGGWRNGAGAGVGHLQMTAWDTARLLWLLDDEAPPAPWLAAGTPALLSAASRQRVRTILEQQGWHTILSSTLLAGLPGWQAGIPATLHPRWINADGSALVDGERFPPDIWTDTGVRFAHKTGSTENYLSDAGIVRGPNRHYLIAMLSNLGTRFAAGPSCTTTWRVPALGAAIDALLSKR
jgi:hypothetical protein